MPSEPNIVERLGRHVESVEEEDDGRVTIVFRNGFKLITDREHIPAVSYEKEPEV